MTFGAQPAPAGIENREAWPLAWPDNYPRTAAHARMGTSKFNVTAAQARDDLLRELRRLNADAIVLSTNVRVRADGTFPHEYREPKDPGAAVYFSRASADGTRKPYALACDTYATVRGNLRALGLTVVALRAIERHGSRSLLERAFTGFAALPPAGGEHRPWWSVLECEPDAALEEVRGAWRRLAQLHHPDRTGDDRAASEINRAWTEAQAVVR